MRTIRLTDRDLLVAIHAIRARASLLLSERAATHRDDTHRHAVLLAEQRACESICSDIAAVLDTRNGWEHARRSEARAIDYEMKRLT